MQARDFLSVAATKKTIMSKEELQNKLEPAIIDFYDLQSRTAGQQAQTSFPGFLIQRITRANADIKIVESDLL